jgi:hypothetical protein
MLALKIIGGVFGSITALVIGMFVYFFIQALDETRNCKLLTPDVEVRVGNKVVGYKHPAEQAYQCADGIHYQPHRNYGG